MKFDVCIPIYRNFKCLHIALRALARDREHIGKLCLYFQDSAERFELDEGVSKTFPMEFITGDGPANMSDILNRLLGMGQSEWVLFMEQDTFLLCDVPELIQLLDGQQIVLGGPLDTMYYGNPNAQHQPHYGKYGRLSPEPGFFHQSFILLKRSAVAGCGNPFTIPQGYKMHGTGVLGGETYYGLRINVEKNFPASRMAFFDQVHHGFGYSAMITWDAYAYQLAVHLYYSSTKEGYRASGFISESEYEWLKSDEANFLQSYERDFLGVEV